MSISILWLARTLPIPLNAGDRIYSAQLAGAVARQGADVVFLGLDNPDDNSGSLADLEARVGWKKVAGRPRAKLRSLSSPLPMVGARFGTREYRDAIAEELSSSDFDAVVFDQYGLSWAVAEVRQLARNRPVLVHVSHDFETRVTDQIARNFTGDAVRRWLLQQNARKTQRAEEHLARNCDLLVTLTEEDREAFIEINPSLKCAVLPPGYAGMKQRSRIMNEGVPRRAIIVGSFTWIAKQMNLERLLEAASPVLPEHQIELHVVGLVPEPLLSRLRLRFPWVVFRGFVDDLGEEFRNARVALVPEEIGGGFKLKILDYIFSRVPVAAVEAALNGIPESLKSQFIVGKQIEAMLANIVGVIDDVERLDAIQRHAFDLAENVFDWNSNGRRFLEALGSVNDARSVRPKTLKYSRGR